MRQPGLAGFREETAAPGTISLAFARVPSLRLLPHFNSQHFQILSAASLGRLVVIILIRAISYNGTNSGHTSSSSKRSGCHRTIPSHSVRHNTHHLTNQMTVFLMVL